MKDYVINYRFAIFKERGYKTRLLTAAYRNVYHWSEFIGGDLAMTIPYEWHKKLNACNVEVISRIDDEVSKEYMDTLMSIPDFVKAFNEKAMQIEEFEKYGAFRKTISGFINGYDEVLQLIRSYMI